MDDIQRQTNDGRRQTSTFETKGTLKWMIYFGVCKQKKISGLPNCDHANGSKLWSVES